MAEDYTFTCPRCERINTGMVDDLNRPKIGWCGSCQMHTDEWQPRRITPPWTSRQVDALNAWQASGVMHPFTCLRHSSAPLMATVDGWVCVHCDYRQEWADAHMADPEWLTELIRMNPWGRVTSMQQPWSDLGGEGPAT